MNDSGYVYQVWYKHPIFKGEIRCKENLSSPVLSFRQIDELLYDIGSPKMFFINGDIHTYTVASDGDKEIRLNFKNLLGDSGEYTMVLQKKDNDSVSAILTNCRDPYSKESTSMDILEISPPMYLCSMPYDVGAVKTSNEHVYLRVSRGGPINE